ncbi:DUF2127 domain-containing protein [Nocardioides humilatus]|uniref:DUF2127 domain-containing protein n=1 Tax=Nocardioides humilatus TaxID=2607660 RepID=A0A5B1LMZ2_9ACTN|nr:DUF2127 domain-containing protein [Nocardioides humilatus]
MTPFRAFDWNLRSCGLHGHVTYRPDEEELAARLHTTTPAGEVWRCLRCGTFALGAPASSGPADEAPLVLRGRALRDAAILRVLAVERGVRGLLLLLLAYGIYRFDGSREALRRTFDEYLPLLKPAAMRAGVDLEETGPVRLIEHALTLQHSTLLLVSIGVLAYGLLQLTEAVGLWLMKRWGEYVAVVATAVFIPLEVYELVEGFTWLKVAALIVNLAAVVYLVWSKRLFGVRGGHAAFEAERHAESLLEVEHAAALA